MNQRRHFIVTILCQEVAYSAVRRNLIRLEIIHQFQLYKTPAPSPISDKERRALLHIRQENSTIKREMAQELIISFRLRPRKPGSVRGPIMFHLNREI